MSIRINETRCVGCGRCADVCPGTLLDVRETTAYIAHPEECWGCASCLKVCPTGAVEYFLGADIGGTGAVLSVRREGPLTHWTIEKTGASPRVITVDARDSNQY